MPRSMTVRLPADLADAAETIARVHGTSINQLLIDALRVEIDRVKSDGYFQTLARRMLERDAAILDALAQPETSPGAKRRRLRT